jgi:hypothetical protein
VLTEFSKPNETNVPKGTKTIQLKLTPQIKSGQPKIPHLGKTAFSSSQTPNESKPEHFPYTLTNAIKGCIFLPDITTNRKISSPIEEVFLVLNIVIDRICLSQYLIPSI